MVNLASLAADLKAPVGALVRAFLLGIPQILGWTLPMGIMVGSLLTLSRLSANSEIVALQAGGYSLRRVTLPVLALGLAFVLIAVGVNEWLAPWANTERERVMVEQVRGRTLPVESRNITLEQYQGGRLSWVSVRRPLQPHGPDHAGCDHDPSRGRAAGGDHLRPPGGLGGRPVGHGRRRAVPVRARWPGGPHRLPRGRQPAAIPYRPGQVAQGTEPPEQMGLRELGAYIRVLRAQGVEARAQRVEWHLKLAIPFASLVFALLGSGMGIQSHRSAVSVGFGLSVGVIFVYYVVMTLGTALAKSGSLPPELGAWIQNLLGLAVGGVLWARLDR